MLQRSIVNASSMQLAYPSIFSLQYMWTFCVFASFGVVMVSPKVGKSACYVENRNMDC